MPFPTSSRPPAPAQQQLKVLSQFEDGRSATLELEAEAGTNAQLHLRQNHPNLKLKAAGAVLGDSLANGLTPLTVAFPPGTGYQTQTIKITW